MTDKPKNLNVENYSDRVRRDHYWHWIATISVALYAWQLHGLGFGLLVLIGLIGAISITNAILIIRGSSFKAIRVNRWVWVAVALIALVLSGASHETI
jgi:hypothetical protein